MVNGDQQKTVRGEPFLKLRTCLSNHERSEFILLHTLECPANPMNSVILAKAWIHFQADSESEWIWIIPGRSLAGVQNDGG